MQSGERKRKRFLLFNIGTSCLHLAGWTVGRGVASTSDGRSFGSAFVAEKATRDQVRVFESNDFTCTVNLYSRYQAKSRMAQELGTAIQVSVLLGEGDRTLESRRAFV